MKFDVERIHIIYKNLIKMGKELDAEKFRAVLEGKGFKKEERVIPTPTGPLKEYLLRDPRSLRDLIVVSVKGFVVDSWSFTNALDLTNLAYEVYESILGDAISYTLVDIIGLFDAIVLISSDVFELVGKLVNSTYVKKLRNAFNRQDLNPFSAGISIGEPAAPNEWIIMNFIPIPDPNAGRRGRRLKVLIEYRGVDSDKGVEFLHNLSDVIKKAITAIID